MRLSSAALQAAAILVCTSSYAQIITLELSYSNPGARSMGLGGAFVALADDATAAFSNPSGLIQLVRPEVSTEGRLWSYSTPYTVGGRASGGPTDIGIDSDPDLRIGRSADDITGLSFASVVYPKGDWCLAFYRHQLANFEVSNRVNGLFAAPPGTGGLVPGFFDTIRDEDQVTTLDLEIVNLGFSGAYRVTDRFALGLGLSYYDGSMEAITDEYLLDDDSVDAYFASNSYRSERLNHQVSATMTGTDWGLRAGFLWMVTRRWSVGGLYRQGPTFDLDFAVAPGPLRPDDPSLVLPTPVSFPDVYGLGAAFRSADGRFTLAFEWDRVEFSRILDSLAPDLVSPVSGVVEPGTTLEDVSELHVGGEYAFRTSVPVMALRLGSWLEPAHRIHYEGDLAFERALLQAGDDQVHLAGGLGLAFERLQIDIGADFSENQDTVSISAIYTF